MPKKYCLLEECNQVLTGKRKKFCCNKHKDRYHNRHNPRGIFAHLSHTSNQSIEDDFHPQDPYSLGQE
jgi:hypothetical protein